MTRRGSRTATVPAVGRDPEMEPSQLNWIANFLWGIADDVLRDLYVRGKYRDVILPMTVLRREVLPRASDAWYDPASVKTGYEVSFTRYFYKPQPLRSLEEIRADILALEKETEGLLGEIIAGKPA